MTWNDDRSEPTFAPTPQDYQTTLERISKRRKTKVKAAGMAAGGATAAGLVVGVLLTLGGGGGADVLEQEQPAGGGHQQLVPTPVPTHLTTPNPVGAPLNPGASPGANTASNSAQATLAPLASRFPGSPAPLGGATPSPTPQPAQAGISRSYSKNTQGAGVTVCNRQTPGSTTPTQDTFCGNGYASETAIDPQHRVPIQSNVCESAGVVGSKTLTFDTSREVDYAIYQGSTLIWRWSTGRPPATRPGHTLGIDPSECWFWSTTWRAIDSHGTPLHGSFTLKTTSYAKELTAYYNPSSYTFTL